VNKVLKWSLDDGKCIDMIYLGENGNITQRRIRILELSDRYIKAYCYLRKSKRVFKYDNILSVAFIKQKHQKGA
jgi:predicted DNA-binding transcriptional regulator YafY